MLTMSRLQRAKSELAAEPEIAARLQTLAPMLAELYDPKEAAEWIRSPQSLLEGAVPAELLKTQEGAERVFAVLQRILDGTYI